MQWASNAAKRADVSTAQKGLLTGGTLAFLFMLGQLWAWQQLNALGYSVAGNPANTFFYLITTLHAAHIIGGFIAWWRIRVGLRRGNVVSVQQSVSLCALYWHFLLTIWLVLFGLMLFT
jgi:cytochrome c oxidase subunit 3